jgi:hypothetical protein
MEPKVGNNPTIRKAKIKKVFKFRYDLIFSIRLK